MQKKTAKQTFHRCFFKWIMPLIRLAVRIFPFRGERRRLPDGPLLVLANHQTPWDPLFLACMLHRHAYFVCTDDLFTKGFASRLLKWFLDPIPFGKAAGDAGAVLEILRRLRAGNTVVLFPEGALSPDGRTGSFKSATGRLIQKARCPVVTVRLRGGYFVSPKWRKRMRRGPVFGEFAGIYPAEEIAAMPTDRLNARIAEDLWQDDYAFQCEHRFEYRGKNLAEHLELFLFLCPACQQLRTLSTRQNRIFCTCGMNAEYDRFGFLHGEKLPFTTVAEWSDWQSETFAQRVESSAPDEILLRDSGVTVNELQRGNKPQELGKAELTATRNGIQFNGLELPFANLPVLAMRRNSRTLLLAQNGRQFQITSPNFCGEPYAFLYVLHQQKADENSKNNAFSHAPH